MGFYEHGLHKNVISWCAVCHLFRGNPVSCSLWALVSVMWNLWVVVSENQSGRYSICFIVHYLIRLFMGIQKLKWYIISRNTWKMFLSHKLCLFVLCREFLQCHILWILLYCPLLDTKKNWAVGAESLMELVYLLVIFIIVRHIVWTFFLLICLSSLYNWKNVTSFGIYVLTGDPNNFKTVHVVHIVSVATCRSLFVKTKPKA
jgi:hypothetical protein